MAASALRVSCISSSATTVLHRACHSSASSSSSLIGSRTGVWRASSFSKLCSVHTGYTARPLQKLVMAFSDASQSSSQEAELTLVNKKCTPCSSKELRPMTEEAAKTLLEQIPGWDLLDVDGQLQLQKSWKAKNFAKGLEFIKSIADVAESEGHHPDLHLVNWNDVKANIWTHSIGLTLDLHTSLYAALRVPGLESVFLTLRGYIMITNTVQVIVVGFKIHPFVDCAGGLTESDFILAAKISALDVQGFLRKSVVKSATNHLR